MVAFRLQCAIWGTLQLLTRGSLGWIPPPPDAQIEWEPVHETRRRLGFPQYNYTPQVISEEMCRYVSLEDCEDADMSMKRHVGSQRSIQRQRKKNPNLGKIKVLVIMIRFSDHVDRELIPKKDVEEFWQTKVPNWLDLNSQGRYSIDPVVINWITTDNTEIHYSGGMRGIVPELQKMAWPILDELDNRPNWDWSEYDIDGNGELDSVVMIHSGYGAETVTTDCFDTAFMDRIWAHAFSTSRNSWTSKEGSMKLNGYTVASAFHGDCGTEAAKIGLTTHEYMHTLGLEDLYDGQDPLAASGIGAFDIMAYPYGQNGDADVPGHLSIWSKVLCEWAEPTIIDQGGQYTLKASEISDEAYRINLSEPGEPFAEYLLIENRQPLEFDINIWSSGLVIYHIDDNVKLQKNLGHPGQPGWPENGKHYQVALLPKDGQYDLEKGANTGDAGDIWEPGDALGPGGQGNTVYPNTDRYQRGKIQETGIRLEVLSQEGTDVTFKVGFDAEAATTQPAVETSPPTMQATTATPTTVPTAGTTPASATQIPTVAPTMPSTTQTVVPTVAPGPGATITPRPTATQRPNIPTLGPREPYLDNFIGFPIDPYLDHFNPSEGQPTASSYLSGFGTHQPQDSYLFTFDSISSLRGKDEAALERDSDQPDAKGFIAQAFEALVTLGGATRPTVPNPRPSDFMPPEYFLPDTFDNTKKEPVSQRNPKEDNTALTSTKPEKYRAFVNRKKEQLNSQRNPEEDISLLAIDKGRGRVFVASGSSSSSSVSTQAFLSSACLSVIICCIIGH